MGLLILMGLGYLCAVGYWHLQAREASRAARWERMGYCLEWRDRLLLAGAVVGVAAGILVSV